MPSRGWPITFTWRWPSDPTPCERGLTTKSSTAGNGSIARNAERRTQMLADPVRMQLTRERLVYFMLRGMLLP
jgi:hypothetical protein